MEDSRPEKTMHEQVLASKNATRGEVCEVALDAYRDDRMARGDKPAPAKKQSKRLATACREAGWVNLDDITRDGLVAHLNELSRGGASPKTVDTLRSMFNTWLDWCQEEGKIQVNPCASIPRRSRRQARGRNSRRGMRAFVGDEPQRLIAAAERDEASPNPRHAVTRSLCYRIWLATGARKGQITRENGDDGEPIRWRDCDLDSERPGLTLMDTKNGDNWFIPLVPSIVSRLKEWRERCSAAGPDDFVFNFGVHNRVINSDLEAAGIAKRGGPTNRPACFHSFRKTFCTHLVMAGTAVPVAQQLMQHRDVKQTLEVYSEVETNELARGIAKVEEFFASPNPLRPNDLEERNDEKPPDGPKPPNGGGRKPGIVVSEHCSMPSTRYISQTSRELGGSSPPTTPGRDLESAESGGSNPPTPITSAGRWAETPAESFQKAVEAAGRDYVSPDQRKALFEEVVAHGRRLDILIKLLMLVGLVIGAGAVAAACLTPSTIDPDANVVSGDASMLPP